MVGIWDVIFLGFGSSWSIGTLSIDLVNHFGGFRGMVTLWHKEQKINMDAGSIPANLSMVY